MMKSNFQNPHYRRASTRREFFTRTGSGLAGIALAQMLQEDGLLAATGSVVDPMAPKKPHHPPTAKSIRHLGFGLVSKHRGARGRNDRDPLLLDGRH